MIGVALATRWRPLASAAVLGTVCGIITRAAYADEAARADATALADDATRVADDLFNAGKAAYQRGDYSAAARAFEEAQRRAPRPETSYNAGLAWEAAGDPLRAANALRVALEAGTLPEKLAADAGERHARLAPAFALLQLDGPASAMVEIAGFSPEHLPFVTYVAPGTTRVSVEFASGAREERRFAISQGERATLSFSEPPLRTPAARGRAQALPTTKPHPSSGHYSLQLVMGVSALGIAGLATGTGIALGARGLAARNRLENGGRVDPGARNDALTLRTEANVAFAGALAFAIAGAILVIESPRHSSAAAFLKVGPGSLELGRRF